MKIIKSYNNFIDESVRDLMKPKSEEEIDLACKKTIDDIFEKANKEDKCDISSDTICDVWYEYSDKYLIFDNYYQYKGRIFYLNEISRGDWNEFELKCLHLSIEQFKSSLEKALVKLK